MTGNSARDDADLLRAHVAGDPAAFGELVRRHLDRLWAVALRTIGDREEAADAVQDALISAYRAAGSFRGDAAVTTWLHRIVVNACLDRIRRRQSHPTVPLPDGARESAGPEPAAPAPDTDTSMMVRAALAELPAEQRAALVLVDVQGYPVAEAAAILGVAEGTIKSRCARGRARMAVALGALKPSARSAGGHAAGPSADGPAAGRSPGGPAGGPRAGDPAAGLSLGSPAAGGSVIEGGPPAAGDVRHADPGNPAAAPGVPSESVAARPLPPAREGRDRQ